MTRSPRCRMLIAVEYTLTASTVIDAPCGEVFAWITDIDRLSEWNTEIPRVIEDPDVLEPGSQWVVEICAMGTHWNSRSQAVEVDADRGLFAYRSASDDGNPSHADWRWEVSEEGAGTRVRVAVDIRPRTFWRKHLISWLRRPVLHTAMRTSLLALSEQVRGQQGQTTSTGKEET